MKNIFKIGDRVRVKKFIPNKIYGICINPIMVEDFPGHEFIVRDLFERDANFNSEIPDDGYNYRLKNLDSDLMGDWYWRSSMLTLVKSCPALPNLF